MLNRLALGLSLAALAVGGTAHAQQQMRNGPDSDGDGMVTRAEAQAKAEQMFDRMDANHDGRLDSADRTAHLAAKFDGMDSDHNGQLSRDEFVAAHQPGASRGEGMEGGHREGGHRGGDHMGGDHMGGEMPTMMMRMADANKDGAISRAEMNTAMLARFDRSDTNHDGKLSKAEREAARAAMRQGMGQRMRHQRMGGMNHDGMSGGMDDHATPPPPAGH